MSDSKGELVNYRLQRAYEALEDANIMAIARRRNICVDQLYYACFYAVSVLPVPATICLTITSTAAESLPSSCEKSTTDNKIYFYAGIYLKSTIDYRNIPGQKQKVAKKLTLTLPSF